MASHGKHYPDRSRDERRRVSRPYNEVPERRMQEPTLTPEQERAYMNRMAFDAMMREAPGSGPVSQLGDAMLDKDNK
jgi:hypothetical protein